MSYCELKGCYFFILKWRRNTEVITDSHSAATKPSTAAPPVLTKKKKKIQPQLGSIQRKRNNILIHKCSRTEARAASCISLGERLLSRILLPIPSVQTHLLTTYCNTDPALPKETPASFREKSKHSFWKQRPKHYTWQAHGCWSSFLQQANQTAYSQHDQFWLEEIWKLCQQVRWAQELKKKKKKNGKIALVASTHTSKVTAQCSFTYRLTASPGHPCCTAAVTGGRAVCPQCRLWCFHSCEQANGGLPQPQKHKQEFVMEQHEESSTQLSCCLYAQSMHEENPQYI